MNNNNLGRISMKTGNLPRKGFPLSADVYTTSGFGEVQPVLFTKCEPNTKSVLSHDVLVRLAPLLSPTRTRVGVRLTSKFVGMSELTENYAFMMADRAVARAEKVFIPKNLPYMSLRKLSAMCLIGSHITLYAMSGAELDTNDFCGFRRYRCKQDYSDMSTGFQSLAKVLCNIDDVTEATLNDNDLFTTSPGEDSYFPFGTSENRGYLNINRLLEIDNEHPFWIPVHAPSFFNFFEFDDSNDGWVCEVGMPRGADFIIPVHLTHGGSDRLIAVAVKLSAFGERLRKAMLGVGYELDFYSQKPKSLMPLFALYKAWYDSYAPQLYENWTQSAAYRLLFSYEKDNVTNFGSYLYTHADATYNNIIHFFVDLGNMWYTKEQDAVTAHIRSLAVSGGNEISSSLDAAFPNMPNSPDGEIHVTDAGFTLLVPDSPDSAEGHAYIAADKSFTQFDLNILQKAYQVVNRNTIAGQRIAEILRANGLGKFVDECKSTFIGESWVDIDINDVNATADSFNEATKQGSTVGSYTGKGVGYDESKTFVYENDEYGYLITLACVVPDSGLCQQEAPWVNAISREDFYLPDWDGKGFEANDKKILCGQIDFYDYSEKDELEKTFGFAPRMTRHKISIGRLNGNFSLRSARDLPLTYSLDDFINIGERDVRLNEESSTEDYTLFDVGKGFKPSMLPAATPNLRYVGRMKWLGNYDRIFNLEGRPSPWNYNSLNNAEGSNDGLFIWFELTHTTYDNFMLFVNNNLKQYFGALPIEDSFETREDGNKGTTDISIGKA